MHDAHIPSEDTIFAWLEEVFGHGIRRPGYPADRWAEDWIQQQFRTLGLERVRAEPVEMPYWEPKAASLTVTAADGRTLDVPCFPLPLAADAGGLELDLVAFDRADPGKVRGAASLYDVTLMRVPHTIMEKSFSTWSYDPAATFATGTHIQPFGREFQAVMEPSIEAGAAAFIGVLNAYPGDRREYYVPYDGEHRPIPGVWISGSDGARLRELLSAGPVRVRVSTEAVGGAITAYNIVGELPGADEETVIVGSHHDGPWSSAVEDSSGISLVLAQAAYWSRVPQSGRPHRMVFLVNSGHMAGGAGQRTFVATHRAELDRCVLEVHLEHAANEIAEGEDGVLRATGEPEVRWWFTSRIPRLHDAVRAAIEAEDLRRSLILPPEAFGEKPTTDGADFHLAGVPLVHYLVAPFYLFDSIDTLDKINRPSLPAVTRAAIRIIESTASVSASEMRAGLTQPA
ncbi:MAG TPA: M28 family peptidase [Dehalococcoidia bacterium]|nr:M28 family peptidase [Dehalococcoidia bacterium]